MSTLTVYDEKQNRAQEWKLWSGPEIAERFAIDRHSAYSWITRWADNNGEAPAALIRTGRTETPYWSDEQVDRMAEARDQMPDRYSRMRKRSAS